MKYACYVVEEDGVLDLLYHTYGVDEALDEIFDLDLKEYSNDKVKLVQSLHTNDKGRFLKFRLKFKLSELRQTQKRYQEYLDSNTDSEVLTETKELMDSYIDTLMTQIAMLTGRCLKEDVEIKDELALTCFNYRKSHYAEVTF